MWAERMRADWQHTSLLAAYIIQAFGSGKGRTVTPDDINPMEKSNVGGSGMTGIPLNTPGGFDALASVASSWRER